jgi:hypothetical protein
MIKISVHIQQATTQYLMQAAAKKIGVGEQFLNACKFPQKVDEGEGVESSQKIKQIRRDISKPGSMPNALLFWLMLRIPFFPVQPNR